MPRWRRLNRDTYQYVDGNRVVATIEAYRPPTNSHFAIWDAAVHAEPPAEDKQRRGCDTLKAAKLWVLATLPRP